MDKTQQTRKVYKSKANDLVSSSRISSQFKEQQVLVEKKLNSIEAI